MANVQARTVLVADAKCWTLGCTWHATGSDVSRVGMCALVHGGGEHATEYQAFPLTSPRPVVEFHTCDALNKDGPPTPGHHCTTDGRA